MDLKCGDSDADFQKSVKADAYKTRHEHCERSTSLNEVHTSTKCSQNGFPGSDSRLNDNLNSKRQDKTKKIKQKGLPCLFENCRKYRKLYMDIEGHLRRVHHLTLLEYGEIYNKDSTAKLNKRKMSKKKKYDKTSAGVFKNCNGLSEENKLRDQRKRLNRKQSGLRDDQNGEKGSWKGMRDNQKKCGEEENDDDDTTKTKDGVEFTIREDPTTREIDYEIIRKEFSTHLKKVTCELVQLTEEERFLLENSGTKQNQNKLKNS